MVAMILSLFSCEIVTKWVSYFGYPDNKRVLRPLDLYWFSFRIKRQSHSLRTGWDTVFEGISVAVDVVWRYHALDRIKEGKGVENLLIGRGKGTAARIQMLAIVLTSQNNTPRPVVP